MNDLISRRQAIDEISRWLGYLDDDMIRRIQIGLRKLPSAQSEPTCYLGSPCEYQNPDVVVSQLERKSARWIPVTNGRGGHECSRCHDYAPSYQSGDEYLAKYCPNCGAKMEGDIE